MWVTRTALPKQKGFYRIMMFEPGDRRRIFASAPGVDFPAALVDGLRTRLCNQPPEAMAHVELIVNTRRMARRIRKIFETGQPDFYHGFRWSPILAVTSRI